MFLFVLFTGFLGPRFALVMMWIFGSWISRAFDSTILAFIGFLLAPWTTLAYVIMWSADGLSGMGWLVVALGLLLDVGSYGGSYASRN